MRLFWVSATYTRPAPSIASPRGLPRPVVVACTSMPTAVVAFHIVARPSSHCSPGSTNALPHTWIRKQSALHVSPFVGSTPAAPSQTSPTSIEPLPHKPVLHAPPSHVPVPPEIAWHETPSSSPSHAATSPGSAQVSPRVHT